MTRFKKTKRRPKTNKNFWLGLFIVVIMVSSGFGVMLGGFNRDSGSNSYDGIEFVSSQNMFVATIDGSKKAFPYLPQQVDYFNVSDDVIQRLKESPQVDLTSAPESNLKHEISQAKFFLDQHLAEHFGTYVRKGFSEENQYGLPVITCNASADVPVVFYEEANETDISVDGSCVTIRSSSADGFLRITTRIIYGLYGVI